MQVSFSWNSSELHFSLGLGLSHVCETGGINVFILLYIFFWTEWAAQTTAERLFPNRFPNPQTLSSLFRCSDKVAPPKTRGIGRATCKTFDWLTHALKFCICRIFLFVIYLQYAFSRKSWVYLESRGRLELNSWNSTLTLHISYDHKNVESINHKQLSQYEFCYEMTLMAVFTHFSGVTLLTSSQWSNSYRFFLSPVSTSLKKAFSSSSLMKFCLTSTCPRTTDTISWDDPYNQLHSLLSGPFLKAELSDKNLHNTGFWKDFLCTCFETLISRVILSRTYDST